MNIQSIEQDRLLVANNFSSSVTYSEKVPDVGQPGTTPAVSGNMFSEKSQNNSMQNSELTKDLISKIQEKIDQLGISLDFCTYGEEDERIAIVVKEKLSGKVIREIPPEATQKLYEKMNELVGILFNEEA